MRTETIKAGYVVTEDGTVLVQVPDVSSPWGFHLADDDQTWDGGHGIASSWELVADDDSRISDSNRERLGWILEDARL
jgi:hypothetical protein